MAAAENNITIGRGTDYSFELTILNSLGVAVDLSSGTADALKCEIRLGVGKPLVARFSTAFSTDGSNGKVVFTLPDTETVKLDSRRSYKYDIYWTDALTGNVDRLIYGVVTVEGNISAL